MSGLIDASILKPEMANSLAEGYRQSREERHKREMDRVTLATRTAARVHSNDSGKAQAGTRDDAGFTIQLKAIGRDPDLNKVFDAFIASGNPDYVMKGYEGKRKLQEQATRRGVLRQYAPELFPPGPSAPGGTAPGAVAPAHCQCDGTPNAVPSGTVAPGVLSQWHCCASRHCQCDGTRTEPATEVNALRQQLAALSSVDDPRAKAMADVVKAQLQELTKRYVVGRSLVTGDSRVLYQAPEPTQTTSPAEQERLANERRRIGLEERRVGRWRKRSSGSRPAFQKRNGPQVRDAAAATVKGQWRRGGCGEMISRAEAVA